MIMRIRTKQKKVNGLKLKMSCLLKRMGIKTSLIDKCFRKKFSSFITLDEDRERDWDTSQDGQTRKSTGRMPGH